MPDPVLVRDPHIFNEIYTGGDVTAIQTTVTVRHGETPITVETVWEIPETEQLNAETWSVQKRNIGPMLVNRAAEATNIEYEVIKAINAYLATLP
jgi:hypothetical protein